jgi:hypothetical protein
MNTRIIIRKTRSLFIRIANLLDRYLQRTAPPEPAIAEQDVTPTHDPVNHRSSTYDGRDVAADARYELSIAESYLNTLPEGRASLQGKSVLELGPGLSFGTILVLRAFGARSAHVADRFLAPFHADYHPKVYRLLAQMVQEKYPDIDNGILLEAADKGHVPDIVQTCDKPLEELGSVFQNIDITVSNAVFEHLYDQFQAIKVLHAITAEGGIGLHQVDFRDHRDFSRPLEYLFLNDVEFAHLFEISHGECGQRTRPFQMDAMFNIAGFRTVKFHANMEAEPAYLEDVRQRLQRAPINLHGYIPQDYLIPISGQFRVIK